MTREGSGMSQRCYGAGTCRIQELEGTGSWQGENRVAWASSLLIVSLENVVLWLPAPGLFHVLQRDRAGGYQTHWDSFLYCEHRGKSSHHLPSQHFVAPPIPQSPDLLWDMESSRNQFNRSMPFPTGDRTVFTPSVGKEECQHNSLLEMFAFCVCVKF